MPHNDLLPFLRLTPEGVATAASKCTIVRACCHHRPPRPQHPGSRPFSICGRCRCIQGAARATPWPPRVIVVTGGDTFQVLGGKDLTIRPAPRSDGDVRVDTFWYASDKEKPAVDASQTWVESAAAGACAAAARRRPTRSLVTQRSPSTASSSVVTCDTPDIDCSHGTAWSCTTC